MKIYDTTLIHPARMIVFGPSGSGKSTFVEKILTYMKEMFGFKFDTITYVSGRSFPKINSIHGIPIKKLCEFTENHIKKINSNKRNLIIFDDSMNDVANNPLMSELFTNMSHHLNISVILILQNLFPKGRFMKDMSVNATYLVLANNPRDKLQVKTLSYQIDGDSGNFYFNCYKDATNNKAFSYLLIDFNQTTPEEIRVRTNIFPNDEEKIVYIKQRI